MGCGKYVVVVIQENNAVFHRADDPACEHCHRGKHLMTICVPGVRWLLGIPRSEPLNEGDTFIAEMDARLVEWIKRLSPSNPSPPTTAGEGL